MQLRDLVVWSLRKWAVVAVLGLFGCGDSTVEVAQPAGSLVRQVAGSLEVAPAASAKIGERKRGFKDTIVYLDGEPVGALSVSELPPQLPISPVELLDGRSVDRYLFVQYLEIIGIPVEQLKSVHFHGGKRGGVTVVASGDVIRKFRNELRFSFMGGDFGKLRVHWLDRDAGFDVNTTIDRVGAISLFIHKPVPTYETKLKRYVGPDGKEFKGIPYVPKESMVRGTRLHLDGKFLGAVKRRMLPDDFLAPDSTDLQPRFLLSKFLEADKVDVKALKSIDFCQGDFLVARFDAEEWQGLAGRLSFSLPRRSQGKILVHFPEDLPMRAWPADADFPKPKEARISSISLYISEVPRARPLSNALEVLPDASEEDPGSEDPQEED